MNEYACHIYTSGRSDSVVNSYLSNETQVVSHRIINSINRIKN